MAPKAKTQTFESLVQTASTLIESVPDNRQHKWRGASTAASVLGACALWFAVFSRLGASVEALPWYIAISFVGVVCAHRATCRVLALPVLRLPTPTANLQRREPLSLLESFSLTYLFVSLVLYAWVSCQANLPKQQPLRVTRFVDIQLVSTLDYANRQSPLAGSQEKADLHKRRSDSQTQQGSTSSTKKSVIPTKTKQPKVAAAQGETEKSVAEKQPAPKQQRLPMKQLPTNLRSQKSPLPTLDQSIQNADDMILVKPAAAVAPVPLQGKQPNKAKPESNRPFFEEVQPPELVEMIENDGSSTSANVFQAGGSSAGGTGATNDLNAYIKALHQRIKSLWSPPRGQPHKAALLFRIKLEGKLAFIKLINSSQDAATDEAAVQAISGAVNGHPLPAAAHLPYLDVQYTFNYKVDELKEVPEF
jgi:TonB C terminal